MNSFSFVALFAALACANAGLLAVPSAKIIQGPSTKTTVVGPDGSAISAVAPGGSIVTEEHPAVVAHTAPVAAYAAAPVATYAAAPLAYSAPVLAAHTAYAAPVVSAYAAPAYSYGAVAHNVADTVVAGPSGTIATSKTVAAPVVAAHGLYY